MHSSRLPIRMPRRMHRSTARTDRIRASWSSTRPGRVCLDRPVSWWPDRRTRGGSRPSPALGELRSPRSRNRVQDVGTSDDDLPAPRPGRRARPPVTAAGSTAVRYARRIAATARNAAEVVRFGGLETGEEPSPFVVTAEQPNYRLRHYFADDVALDAPPILLIPPLMMATEVWDVSPSASAVVSLHKEGIDTWVVDFGDPGREPGGLERTLTDHVLAVSDAVDRVVAATGKSVVLSGYSQGGMFAYQTAAYRRGKDIDSLVTFG